MSLPEVVDALHKATNQTSSETRQQGENLLNTQSTSPGFFSTLLVVLQNYEYPLEIRSLAVIHFKNRIGSAWRRGASVNLLQEEKDHIRGQILSIAVELHDYRLYKQFALAVSKIVRLEYPRRWPNVFEELIQCTMNCLSTDIKLNELASLLEVLHQTTKALSSVQIGPTRAQLNIIIPHIIEFTSSAYIHLMGLQTPQGALPAYSALKITCTLMYHRVDDLAKSEAARNFFTTSLDMVQQLFSAWSSSHSDNLRKHITRFGKLYIRMLDRTPVTFCLMPRYLDVVLFYQNLLCQRGPHVLNSGNSVTSEEMALYTTLTIQAMMIIDHLTVLIHRNPQNVSNTLLPLKLRPHNEEQRHNLIEVYNNLQTNYFQAGDNITRVTGSLVSNYFLMKQESLEKWVDDPEEFFVEESNASSEFRTDICAQNIFHHLARYFPSVLDQSMHFLNETLCQQTSSLGEILRLDCALQTLQFGTVGLGERCNLKTIFYEYILPKLKDNDSNNFFRIIRRRICLVIGEWTSISDDGELRSLFYEFAVNFIYTKHDQNDIAVRLECFDAIKRIVDSVDFEVKEFAPYAESIFANAYILLNEELETLEAKAEVLSVLCVLVEALGPSLSLSHVTTIMNILPPLWTADADNQLIKGVILQIQKHLLDATRENSYICYGLALDSIKLVADPNAPLFSFLAEESLAMWKSLLQNAPATSNEIEDLFPIAEKLLTISTDYMGEVLTIIDSYIKLNPDIFNRDPDMTLRVLSLFAQYISDSNVETVMSLLQTLETFVKLCDLESLIPAIGKSGVMVVLMGQILTDNGEDTVIVQSIIASRTCIIFSRIAIKTSNGFVSLVPTEQMPKLVDRWLCQVKMISDPSELKIYGLGVSSVPVQLPEIFLEFSDEYKNLWSLLLEDVNETESGDAEIYYQVYPGETELDLSIEDLRMQKYNKSDPVHTVATRDWLRELVSHLRSLGQGYQEALSTLAM